MEVSYNWLLRAKLISHSTSNWVILEHIFLGEYTPYGCYWFIVSDQMQIWNANAILNQAIELNKFKTSGIDSVYV